MISMVNPPQESRSELLLKEVLSLISWMGTLEKDWENHSTLKKCRDCTGMWEGDGFTLFYNANADFSWHSGNVGFLYGREIHKHLFQGIAFSFYFVFICGKYRGDGEVALRYRKCQFLMTKSQQMKTNLSHRVHSINSAQSGDGSQSAAHQHGIPHS